MSYKARVYVAAPWACKDRAKEVKSQLEAAGFKVTSRWIDFEIDPAVQYDYPEKVMRREAVNDLDDLDNSEVMLYLNLEKSEGKAFELGWFLADQKEVFVVGGKQNNVFLHLPEVYGLFHVDSVEDFIGTFD